MGVNGSKVENKVKCIASFQSMSISLEKEVFYAHQGCIYLMKNTFKKEYSEMLFVYLNMF